MAHIFKARHPKMRTARGRDGSPIMVEKIAARGPNKGKRVLVPQREPVLGRDGKPVYVEADVYSIAYTDASGKRKTASGYRDLASAKQKLATIERSVERQRAGIVDVSFEHGEKALDKHVADWIDDLQRAGRAYQYTRKLHDRMKLITNEIGWTKLGHIDVDSFSSWLGRKRRAGLSDRTCNHYIEAVRALCNWLVSHKRMEKNPIAGIAKAEATEPVIPRRAATLDELGKIVTAKRGRGLIYRTLAYTGLRRMECQALRWGDLLLDDPKPAIQLRASTTKSRRADAIPLPADLAKLLREYRPEGWKPGDTVFGPLPTYRTFRRDLKSMGIEPITDAGRLDLHSLRVTYGTMLAKAGVNIRTAMELMRHTDIRLTTRVYTDARLLDTAGAVEQLPRLDDSPQQEQARATGTDGRSQTYVETYVEGLPKGRKTYRMPNKMDDRPVSADGAKKPIKQGKNAQKRSDKILSLNCGWGDSNPHDLSATGS